MKRYWLSILILAAGIVFLVVISGYSLLPLLHLPSFIITVVTPFFFVTILFGFKETCRSFTIIRKNENEHDTLMNALAFFRVYGKATWFSAVIASLAGGIGTLALLDDKASIGNLALALVGLLYCGVVQLAIVIPYTILIHKKLGNGKIRGDIFSIFGSLFGVLFAYLLLFSIFRPYLSQQSVQTLNQKNPIEFLNGIRDKTDIGRGYGIFEYELYDVPGNESSDFQAFIKSYIQMLGEYVFDQSSKYWIEDNKALNENAKTLMADHKRNLSTTRLLNPNGSTTFIFNFLNSKGKYELYSIDAYKKNISYSSKTTKNFVRRSFAEVYAYIRRGWVYFMEKDYYLVISNLTELFFKENVLYFPIRDKAVLKRITDFIYDEGLFYSEGHGSYTITANGFLKVENPEIARQTRTSLIIEGLIPSKLFPFINIDKERERAIRDTLDKVAKKFNAEEDANGDGETNCVDAVIWFWLMYPYRKDVKITTNDNLNHAFITVKIGNTWKCIEPQAFVLSKESSYFMEDLWGSRYDSTYNKDEHFLSFLSMYYKYKQ